MTIIVQQVTQNGIKMPSLPVPAFYAPIWQTAPWASMLLASNAIAKSFFVYKEENGICQEYAFLEKRSVGGGFFALFCLGGPVSLNGIISQEFRYEIEQLAQAEQVVFVQFEPVAETTGLDVYPISSYKKFIQQSTVFIDLAQTEEQILAGMKQKGRYNIKIAQKNEIEVSFCPPTEENLDKFMHLLQQTSQRNHFSVNNRAYFQSLLAYGQSQNNGWLYVAMQNGQWLAAGVFFFFEQVALYYYGASTGNEEQKRLMAPYLLHLEIIREAKKRGCTIYDFLWIASQGASKDHPLSGVTDFKLKFSSWVYEFPPARIYVAKPFLFLLLQAYRFVRRFV